MYSWLLEGEYQMKKIRLVIIILVITVIAIIFPKSVKSYIQQRKPYSNKNVYNFLKESKNQKDVYGVAIKLNQGSSANACVYFMAEVLRRNNFNVPEETNNVGKFISLLQERGLKKQIGYQNLSPGDICFTTDAKGNKNGVSTHTYVFMKWVKQGSYDYAYICDNQAKDYKDKVYHIRNIKIIDKANGFDKDAFAFFMKKT